MKTEIKVGMQVRLLIGGPVMNVKAIENDLALCEWMVVDRKCSMHFKVSNLVKEETAKNS
ncbi:hypothetical protein [Adhaeribacter terreus]|uniref:DUF2158 domain-containing protein n=1 Tax=Adhaeribacter terreus TaxID=529703 RepID=A0ABW0EG89_9BACT